MGAPIHTFKVDGGASANDFLLEFQSGIIDRKVYRPSCIETTSLGAAYMAGLATGYWSDLDDISENWEVDKVFEPEMTEEKRKQLLAGWHKAVDRTLEWEK